MVPAPMAPFNCNSKGDHVSCLVDEILACCAELSEFPDLKPCAKVNKAFEKLVGCVASVLVRMLSRRSVALVFPFPLLLLVMGMIYFKY